MPSTPRSARSARHDERMGDAADDDGLSKIPDVDLLFWVTKITATTLGETGGDLLSMTLNIGYAVSTLIFFGVFLAALAAQLISRKYRPAIYWLVIVATSTAGTTMSDFMDRTLGLGYAKGSLILVAILITILSVWRKVEGHLRVEHIRTRRAELFYWVAILFSNTLGTALGDFLADSSGLGFGGGAALISGLLVLVVLAHFFTPISKVVLFWIAFVLTRPFGATFGDLMTKPAEKGGYAFGTIGSSAILFGLLVALVVYATVRERRRLSDAPQPA
jgi:uncharacterized membrane-anchored protein